MAGVAGVLRPGVKGGIGVSGMARSLSSNNTGGGGSELDRESLSAAALGAMPSLDTTKLVFADAWLVVVA